MTIIQHYDKDDSAAFFVTVFIECIIVNIFSLFINIFSLEAKAES